MNSENSVLLLSIKDLFTAKMLKYSLLPFVGTVIFMYILFFWIAGVGLESLGSMDVQTTETSIQNGIPHTESFSAQLEGTAIIKFLMSHAITSWIATFLVYTVGSFLVLYVSIFATIIVIGFMTPLVLKELQHRHYQDVEIIGHSNLAGALLNVVKWAAIMVFLFIIMVPLYFIPVIGLIAFNFPMYYFFHKMMTYDVSSTLCTKEEDKQIKYYHKTTLRLKTLALYLISLIPFAIFFTAIYFVIYIGHSYFLELRDMRNPRVA
jgi:hypothetical protein